MQKPRTINDHPTRESYLRAATIELRPWFAKLGLTLPEKIRFAVAFTSHGKKGRVAGECWHASASDDGHHEIIIRADFADPAEVLGILVHELVHAALPPDAKHGKEFREAALKIGLEGQMRHALPGAILKERLNELSSSLGPFPHGRLNFDRVTLAGEVVADKPKKQGTRMLKAECLGAGCGYTVRVAARWIKDCGAPHCPKHGSMNVPPLSQESAAAVGADAVTAEAME
ncbi:SprT-like domain-containing protein [Methylocapsa sp. D3K7]|uniref:SprT-like domain-containing protein n=1 Tax=Methylocapsa sp. D3K7 TaxID=3041435 RepID=UPI00244EBF9C|nr:SprT-like domain-containing protein [Methylocapsa sp. D3K7]WGJ13871.1 SprT-like domain-containing protein [Methylocapsa sp. D3K7]